MAKRHVYPHLLSRIILCILLCPVYLFPAQAQQSKNITLAGHMPYPSMGCLSALWGYTAPDGREYALVGTCYGMSVVDVTEPDSLEELYFVAGPTNIWREVKTWGHYAYCVTEAGTGLTIIDLQNLPGSNLSHTVFTDFGNGTTVTNVHTLWIDEQGHCYLWGATGSLGANAGCLVLDLTADPLNPTIVGQLSHTYYHDGYVRGDTVWGAAMYDGAMEVYNVSDWSAPLYLGSHGTPGSFTHNTCLSDDGKTAFTTDEIPDGYVTAYDVSDVSNIMELDRIKVDPVGHETPHNVHYLNGWLPTAYYREGVLIFDAHDPSNLVVTGYYDTHWPDVGANTFEGVWEVYPYFPSGRIIASDRNNGLFVLEPEYVRACYLGGLITDSSTGEPLSGVYVDFSGSPPGDVILSIVDGTYKTGAADSGVYTLTFAKSGYIPKTLNVTLDNGVFTTLNVELYSEFTAIEEAADITQIRVWPVPAVSALHVDHLPENVTGLQLTDLTGKVLKRQTAQPASQNVLDVSSCAPGTYLLRFEGQNGNLGTRKIVIGD